MDADHLPFAPATAFGRVEPDLTFPTAQPKPLPRPRSPEDEPKPFTAMQSGYA